jgi:hypothetical protein
MSTYSKYMEMCNGVKKRSRPKFSTLEESRESCEIKAYRICRHTYMLYLEEERVRNFEG